jgi:hypothetical protein
VEAGEPRRDGVEITDQESLFESVKSRYPEAARKRFTLVYPRKERIAGGSLKGYVLNLGKGLRVFCAYGYAMPCGNEGKRGFAVLKGVKDYVFYEFTPPDVEAAFQQLEEEFQSQS